MAAAVGRLCERRGWTPLRRRGLDLAEAQVLGQVDRRRIGELNLEELIWHMLALRSAGHDAESVAWRTCEAQLDGMNRGDHESEAASPAFKHAPLADTIMTLQSLAASGLAANHPAVAAAVESLRHMRRARCEMLSTIDLSRLIQLIGERIDDSCRFDDALPPEITLAQTDPRPASRTHHPRGGRSLHISKIAESLIKPLLDYQNRDGGWGADFNSERRRRTSQTDSTASVLMALEKLNSNHIRQAKACAVAYLRNSQQADGSWANDSGTASLAATSRAICGLVAAGVDQQDEALAAGINWLIIRQHESSEDSGSWEKGSALRATAANTAAALLALVAAGKANHASARRAVELLLQAQRDEGRWNETGFNNYDAASGRWLRNELQSTTEPLLALSRWIVAAAADQICSEQGTSLRLVGATVDD
jgi:hypothetical protein